MGHVDHGKTTLLDSIRHTKVTVEKQAVSRNILVLIKLKMPVKITFLDTPGHAKIYYNACTWCSSNGHHNFSSRGDDGVMPQTIEAINHAKEANVPTIVVRIKLINLLQTQTVLCKN